MLSSKTKISQYLKSSNYSHIIYDKHKGNHLNTVPLLKILIDGEEAAEASQYAVMNWTRKRHWVCTSTVHDKYAMSESKYIRYNRYKLKKNAADAGFSL